MVWCGGRRRILFSYSVLVPAALKFFVSYADGAVESLWSIDQYFEFVLVLLLSTGLSFQVRTFVVPCCSLPPQLPKPVAQVCRGGVVTRCQRPRRPITAELHSSRS